MYTTKQEVRDYHRMIEQDPKAAEPDVIVDVKKEIYVVFTSKDFCSCCGPMEESETFATEDAALEFIIKGQDKGFFLTDFPVQMIKKTTRTETTYEEIKF